jgi:hypothetical protein
MSVSGSRDITVKGSKLRDMTSIRLCRFILVIFQQKSCNQTNSYILSWNCKYLSQKNERISERGGHRFLCKNHLLQLFVFPITCHPFTVMSLWFFFFLSFLFVQKLCTHVSILCVALFLLISLTDSGTQSVNNKDRLQKLINEKLIYYKYSIIKSHKAPMEFPSGSHLTQCLHKHVQIFSCPGILSSCTFLLHQSIINTCKINLLLLYTFIVLLYIEMEKENIRPGHV